MFTYSFYSKVTLKLQREEIHMEANSLRYIKNVLIDLPVLDMYLRLEIIQQFLPHSLCLQIHELLQRKPAGRKAQSLHRSNYTPPNTTMIYLMGGIQV